MMINRQDTLRLWFFAAAAVLLSCVILVLNHHLIGQFSQTSAYTYFNSVTHGVIGSGYGASYAPKPEVELQPGDILLGGWSNCAYGRYAHVGMFLGNDQVLEGYVDYGVTIQPLDHYLNYTYLCFLRVDADDNLKEAAIAYARSHLNEIFHPLAFKTGERYWNCTKIIWKAYQENGVDLDPVNDIWITPDAFQTSPYVINLFER
jgi:uncharacterized protein YycO